MSALPSPAPSGRRSSGRQRRADLRLVERPRHPVRWVGLLVALAATGVFGIVALAALAAEASFTARSLEGEVSGLSVRYNELTAEVAELESPDRIRAAAVDELGMVPAESPLFVVAAGTAPPDGERSEVLTSARLNGGTVADPLKSVLSRGP